MVLSRVRLIRVSFVFVNLNPINDTYIQVSQSISGRGNGKRPTLSRKKPVANGFEYLTVIPESRLQITIGSKIVHARENSCHS